MINGIILPQTTNQNKEVASGIEISFQMKMDCVMREQSAVDYLDDLAKPHFAIYIRDRNLSMNAHERFNFI